MKRVVIDPLTRLEGHGRVEIFLDEAGAVAAAYLVVPDLRGFEAFCVGRPAEEMPRITARICGLCPEAHHLASSKALDALFSAEPPPAAKLVRELLYCAFFVADHATHFFVLAGPDLFLGPGAPPETRHILGVLQALGGTHSERVIACIRRNREAVELLGGRKIHLVAGLPGGWSRPVTETDRARLAETARANVELALSFLDLFEKVVLRSPENAALLASEHFEDRTHYVGTVDEHGRPNFYDGTVRVVDPGGLETARFAPAEYQSHIAERVETWSYAKLPFLRAVGWHGLVDGAGSGIYCASPLGRLNVASGMATPRAHAELERMRETVGTRSGAGPRLVHNRMATHWARLIELLYAAERMAELADDPRLTEPRIRTSPGAVAGEGVGSVEAPRGLLIHHYRADERGMITGANLVVGTTHNQAPMALSITRAARGLIRDAGRVTPELLNRIEMVVRAYDPCLSCAAHAWPGGSGGLAVTVRDHRGAVLSRHGGPGTAGSGAAG